MRLETTARPQRKFNHFSEITSLLQQGTLTCSSIVSHYLQNIEKQQHLNAFLEVWPEEALQRAALIDEKISKGQAGKLAGMVIALKDNICYKGHKVSVSSKILEGFTSMYSATVVERLLAEDAIIIGRTNCDEFAMGASNENSAYGPVLNAYDNTKVSGGSSGGSAVAVQSDMCFAALGTDTGGSVRQPASFCGMVGYKPTYGRVSRWGLLAYASSFDQAGPITSSVEDMQLILSVISGADHKDATCSSKEVPDFKAARTQKARIAYLRQVIEHEGIDPEIRESFLQKTEEWKKAGHTVEAVDFEYIDYLVPCYYVLTTAEASSNLARYQGLQYGYRSPSATDFESTFKRSRSEGFGEEVKRRIMLGTFVLSSDFYDAYYTQAQKVRRVITEKTNEILSQYDFITLPTTPTVAFGIGEKAANPIAMYLADIFTVQANITGIPAVSVPGGETTLPWGLQIMGKKFADAEVLAFAKQITS